MKKAKPRSIQSKAAPVLRVSTHSKVNGDPEQTTLPSPKLKWVLALSIFAIAILLYSNTFNHSFTLDDPGLINNNKITKAPVSFENIKLIFSTPHRRGNMDIENSLYRPFSKLLYHLEWNLFNGGQIAFHAVNILLYGLLGGLIFLVFYEAMNRRWLVPYLASVLFICHPLHTEVVANIKNGEDVLALLGIMGALRSIQLYMKTKGIVWLFAGALSFLAALFSKESSVVAVGLVPLFIYYFTPMSLKQNLKVSGIMFLCALIFIFCRWKVLEGLPQLPLNELDNLLVLCENGTARFATALGLLGLYLQKFLVPFPLSCDYSYSSLTPMDFSSPMFLLSGLVLTGLLVYAIKALRKKEITGFGIAWFFISMAISSNLFFLIGTSFAERLLFLPSLGLSLAVVSFIARFTSKTVDSASLLRSLKDSPKIWMLFIPVFLLFSFKTIDRNKDWETDITLFSNDVKNYPNSIHLLFYMGNHPWWAEPNEVVDEQLAQIGYDPVQVKDSIEKESMLAIHYLSRAFSIIPDLPSESYYYLGKGYNTRQRFDSAIYFLEKSLTGRYSTVRNDSYYQLGLAYRSTNKLDSAYKYLMLAYQADPTNAGYLNNLGILYCTRNQPADALPLFKKAHEYSPTTIDFINNIGAVYGNLGQTDSAIAWFEKALAVDPKNLSALNFLNMTWRNKGDINKADEYKRMADEVMTGKGSN